MKFRTLRLALFSVLLIASAVARPRSGDINSPRLKADIQYLASPELQGRGAPGWGSEIAQRYIATRFAELGLEGFPDMPEYYQNIPLIVSKTDYDESRLIVSQGGERREFLPEKEVFFFPRGGKDEDITASVLLTGYGIKAPEFKWDDFAGADPKGKFLLIFNREPQENDSTSPFNGAKATKYSQPSVKVRIAKEVGARGLLVIQPPNNGLPLIEKSLDRYRGMMNEPIVQLADDREAFPVFYLKSEVAKLLLGDDFDLSAYQRELDEQFKGKPTPLDDGLQVTLKIRFREVQETQTANIVGMLPGKSDEAVLILAHHDHLGTVGDSIYFGADDNASGTAGLLTIAEAFAKQDRQPRRDVIFLSTGCEEDGTLGALYFSRHLPVPADKIVAAINMDEIGRDASSQFRAMMDASLPMEQNMLMIFYSGQTPALKEVIQRDNSATQLDLILEPVLHFSGSSDHIHFHDLGIPSMFFFTGFHRDYHTPHDTPGAINYEKTARVAELAFSVARDLAQMKKRLTFDRSITKIEGTGRKYGN